MQVRQDITIPSRCRRGHRPLGAVARGLTLLEVILALGLMILLFVGVFGFYATTLKARASATNSLRQVLLMRALLEQVSNEIRHASGMVLGDGIGFSGTEERLTIVRYGMPQPYAFDEYDPMRQDLPPAQLDVVRVTYELLWDQELRDENDDPICHGLWRTHQETFDPNPSFVVQAKEDAGQTGESELQTDFQTGAAGPTAQGELFAPEIKYLKFEFFDGAEWKDRWQVAAETTDQGAGAAEGETNSSEQPGGGAGSSGDLTQQLGQMGQAGAGGAGGKQSGLGSGRKSALGTSVTGGSQGQQKQYALPQAVRITIGQIPVPLEEKERLKMEEFLENEKYHPDRFTTVVYLRQADQSLLSSRQHGVEINQQVGEQTEGR